jgi:hypothetical protein
MTMTTPSYPGDRLVRRGSLRFELRDIGDDKRLLLLGDHWQTGAEVVLRTFDADESDYFKPGPLDEREHGPEWQIAEDAGAHLYDPDAKDPPNRVGFTTSPAAYDHGCTVELERFTCAIYPHDKPREFRKVLVRGGTGFSVGQVMRYFDFSDEDPRVVRDAYLAKRAAQQAADDAERREADEDTAYLATLTLAELETEHKRRSNVDLMTYKTDAARQRSKTILVTRRQEALDAEWAALQARIPCGATLLVPANRRDDGPRQPGVADWVQSLTGAIGLRSARRVLICRRPNIPSPRQKKRAEDPNGDNPYEEFPLVPYAPSGLQQPPGGIGSAYDWAVHKVKGDLSGNYPRQTVCMLHDILAYTFNWEGLHPFYYHTKDWDVADENDPAAPLWNQQSPVYARLLVDQHLSTPTPVELDVDHRYRDVGYYENESGLALLDDGSVVVYDAWGSEIRMHEGTIEFIAAGDVVTRSGRNAVVMAAGALCDFLVRPLETSDETQVFHGLAAVVPVKVVRGLDRLSRFFDDFVSHSPGRPFSAGCTRSLCKDDQAAMS